MSAAELVKARMRDLLQRRSGRVYWRGPGDVRRVALTFDDGPQDLTDAYLAVLDRHGAAATFFVMGDLTEARPRAIREYLRRGHQVGGHGYDHTRMTRLSTRELIGQLERTERAIGPVPQGRLWVRPPYGALSPTVVATMLVRGYRIGMWSLDSHDFELDADGVVGRCAPERVVPGDVLLLHEGYAHTLEALPRIIQNLQGAGYELVTMADLVAT
jgi:peptidoglycan/xylan/chitin deacetylase (PgdA/CDA1 family)